VTSLVVGRWLVVTRVHCGQTVHPKPIVTITLTSCYYPPVGYSPHHSHSLFDTADYTVTIHHEPRSSGICTLESVNLLQPDLQIS